MERWHHPYEEFLGRLSRPSRYVGGEYGQVSPPPRGDHVRLALAFPDLYELGMSHLGIKILYHEVNSTPGLVAERVFAADTDLELELRARGLPLVSLESATPLRDFDLVGFSLQYELTYTNLLAMLDLGGIPILVEDRREGDPIIVAGGPCAAHPEPLARFIDLFLLGDGEEALPSMMLALKDLRGKGLGRREVVRSLAGMPGVYAPGLYRTVTSPEGFVVVEPPSEPGLAFPIGRNVVADLDDHPFPSTGPVSHVETVFDRFSVEIARGCLQGCRFCQAGMTYRPLRERSPESVVRSVLQAVERSGYDEVSLTSLSTADYSGLRAVLAELAGELHRRKVALSVSSLRAYGLPEDVLGAIASVRATGLTLAPEAGSQRLRDVINKNVSDQDLAEAVRTAFELGWSRIKLYFMIGLPTETDQDVEGIVRTAAMVRQEGRRAGRRGVQVTASVSTFVPRPHTPFQWEPMIPLEEISRRQAMLREAARAARVQLKAHDPQMSWLEAVVARGDRRVGRVIERAYRLGARFDGWDERLDMELWRRAFQDEGVDPQAYLRPLEPGCRLPWDHLSQGVTRAFLARERDRAMGAQTTPACIMEWVQTRAGDTRPVCHGCGLRCDVPREAEKRERFAAEGRAKEVPRPAAHRLARARGGRTRGSRPPAPAFDQPEPIRYRVNYTKLGQAAYLGHLDMVRDMPRIVRRAGFTAHYSEGYHPKAVMTFGPALALGVQSVGEWVDLSIEEEVDPEELVERLERAAGSGVRFLRARRLPRQHPKLSKAIRVVEHALVLPPGRPLPEVGLDAIDQAGPARLERRGKEVYARWRDLVHSLWAGPLPGGLARDFGLEPAAPTLFARLVVGARVNVRITEVADALGLARDGRELRLACWGFDRDHGLVDPMT